MKNKNPLKICLLGLDNAGKTTILHALTQMYGFEEEVKDLAPTIQIKYHKRDFLNQNLVFWDYGGQERFRTTYLKDNYYFLSINALIFVIDIQDEERFPLAIEYLKSILQILSKDSDWMSKKELINICFNKADYNLIAENRIDYQSRMNMLETIIQKDFSDQKFLFFATSIYNLYSIVHLVSHSIQAYLTFYNELQYIFSKIAKTVDYSKCLVYDHTGIVIAEAEKDPISPDAMDNTIHSIISHHLRIFRQVEENNLQVKQTWDTDGFNAIYNTQFNLYDSTKQVDLKMVKKEREQNNPFYMNYYFSIFFPKDHQKEGEKLIPDVIESIRSLLQKQFDH